jgi:Na+/H+ antiporter NhaD/arsenite permease-like protein
MQETASNPIIMGTAFWIATAIFLGAYGLIVSESPKLVVDWNVIILLVGRMVITNIRKPTGVF